MPSGYNLKIEIVKLQCKDAKLARATNPLSLQNTIVIMSCALYNLALIDESNGTRLFKSNSSPWQISSRSRRNALLLVENNKFATKAQSFEMRACRCICVCVCFRKSQKSIVWRQILSFTLCQILRNLANSRRAQALYAKRNLRLSILFGSF